MSSRMFSVREISIVWKKIDDWKERILTEHFRQDYQVYVIDVYPALHLSFSSMKNCSLLLHSMYLKTMMWTMDQQ